MGWFEDVTGQSSGSPRPQSDAPAGAFLGTRPSGRSLVATGDGRTAYERGTNTPVSLASQGGSGFFQSGYTPPGRSIASEGGGDGGNRPVTQTKPKPDPDKPDPAKVLNDKQKTTFADALAEALGFGSKQIDNLALDKGLTDQYGVMDYYNDLIKKQKRAIDPYSDTTPTIDEYLNKFKTNDAFTEALGAKTNRYRSDLTNSLNTVAPEGFESNWFGDTADDAVLNAILGQQQTDAMTVLDRAKARGQLNDVGYGRSLTDLEGQFKTGMGKLQDIGGGVLEGYRGQVGNERTNAVGRIGGASFGSPYDVTSVIDRLNNLKTSLTGSLENDLYGAIGGQKFFDVGTSIGSGGVAQGSTNPSKINFGANPLLASFAPEEDRRTYGSTGSTASVGVF